jgi:hypothetical protein
MFGFILVGVYSFYIKSCEYVAIFGNDSKKLE